MTNSIAQVLSSVLPFSTHLLPPSPLYSPLPLVVPPRWPRLLQLKVSLSTWLSRREISGEEVPTEATPCCDSHSTCIDCIHYCFVFVIFNFLFNPIRKFSLYFNCIIMDVYQSDVTKHSSFLCNDSKTTQMSHAHNKHDCKWFWIPYNHGSLMLA